VVTWIVATPYYLWLGLGAAHNSLPSPGWIAVIFGFYLVGGFFVVRAILKKLNRNEQK